ncbi:hypothetical protein NP233_g1755 [Leucocoprinus birnbaumii]|uniref:Uncharacterized protein n=1 Tax=Leucocoprinus birnbaumii TaxID=56174 RepID=A0AAD5W3G5_9AGAR|nr:hypothetical protein NP233_g1755 [Leucocoprinus birnbaumii]
MALRLSTTLCLLRAPQQKSGLLDLADDLQSTTRVTAYQTVDRNDQHHFHEAPYDPPTSHLAGHDHWAGAPQPSAPIDDHPMLLNNISHHIVEPRQHEIPHADFVFPGPSHDIGGPDIQLPGFNHWHEGPDVHVTMNYDQAAGFQYSFVVATGVYNVLCQGYLVGHLLVPSLYFFRANQVFRDAGLSPYSIAYYTLQSEAQPTDKGSRGRQRAKKRSLEKGSNSNQEEESNDEEGKEDKEEGGSSKVPEKYHKLKRDWETLIDDLVEEWRTLNIVSAMLIPGILTLFQVDGASNDPVTRSLAHWALILALWSLVYGCLYVIQFRRMRNDHTIIGWAMEAKKPHAILWNTWVMLALPVVSLACHGLVHVENHRKPASRLFALSTTID